MDQSLAQQARKSIGHGGAGGAQSDRLGNASTVHGVERVGSGFDIVEVVSEYRALRASVLRLWREILAQADLDDITPFNGNGANSRVERDGSGTRPVARSSGVHLRRGALQISASGQPCRNAQDKPRL